MLREFETQDNGATTHPIVGFLDAHREGLISFHRTLPPLESLEHQQQVQVYLSEVVDRFILMPPFTVEEHDLRDIWLGMTDMSLYFRRGFSRMLISTYIGQFLDLPWKKFAVSFIRDSCIPSSMLQDQKAMNTLIEKRKDVERTVTSLTVAFFQSRDGDLLYQPRPTEENDILPIISEDMRTGLIPFYFLGS